MKAGEAGGGGEEGGGGERATDDFCLAPSLRKVSISLNISFLPALASTGLPLMLMEIFLVESAIRSFLMSRYLITMQTYTPQSEPFSCCGLSVRLVNLSGFPSSWPILCTAVWASLRLEGERES